MASRSSMRWLRIFERSVPVFLPVLVAVGGAVWSVTLFLNAQSEAAAKAQSEIANNAQTRLIEAQKPFLDKQLELYVLVSKAVGTIVTVVPANPEWESAHRDFLALFWSELPMVENADVETAMVNLRDAIDRYLSNESLKTEVQKRSYCLGHAIRQSIQESWKVRVVTGDIPSRVFNSAAVTSSSTSPPPGVSVDPDCGSEVRTK